MEKSFVFNSINGDRRYKAEDFREYFASFIGNGVFPNPSNQLQVLSNNDMTISVTGGKGFINGAIYVNTENLILNVDVADSVLNRIDRIVLRFDNLERNITCKVKKGTFASNPIAPGLQRDADAYELSIAEIKINKGAVSILQSNITDTRLDSSVCGIVTQTVKTIDTKTLYNKLEAYIDERGKDVDGWLTSFKSERELSFNEWFNTIKGVLDGDVAGNLANRILEVENKLKNMKLESTAIDVVDTANNFTADSHGKKLLEDVLVQIDKKAKEAFQGADSGKKIIATAVGSPLSDSDTFSDMGNKIERLTKEFKMVLESKHISVASYDKIQNLIQKIKEITVSRHLEWANKDVWVPTKACIETKHQATMSAVNGCAYLIGGKVNNTYVDTVHCYDSHTNTWSERTRMDKADFRLTSQAVGNFVYVIGGYEDMKKTRKYSTIGDYWTNLNSSPTDSLDSTSTVIGDNIYVLSSYIPSSKNKNECFNTSIGTWTTKASIPEDSRYVGICCAWDSEIYFTRDSDIYKYYPKMNEWRFLASSSRSFSYVNTKMIAHDSCIYFFSSSKASKYNINTYLWEDINMSHAFSEHTLDNFALCRLNNNTVLRAGGSYTSYQQVLGDNSCSYYIF